MSSSIVIEVPDNEWISANSRFHRFAEAERTKSIRNRAAWVARSRRLRCLKPVHVTALVSLRASGRADADNAEPTMKAILDGFTDAGVWPDDDSQHVLSVTYRRGPKHPRPGWRSIHLIFTESVDKLAVERRGKETQ